MDTAAIALGTYLEKYLNDIGHRPKAVQIKPVSTEGANYSSALFKITVEGSNKDTLHMFSKVGSIGDKLREELPVDDLFVYEKVVYEELQPSYEAIQIKYRIPKKDRFPFSKYYGSSLERGREVFLFEDLNETGYQIYDRFESLKWDHVSENIKVLAKFHALSFALEKENPELYKKIAAFVFPVEAMMQVFAGDTEPFLEGLSEHHRTKLRKFLEDVGGMAAAADLFKPFGRSVIIHGDYRPSNIMYKQAGHDITVLPVDYQTIRVGCAVTDILYYVVMATDGAFRKQHFDQLMDFYHSQLSLFLAAMDMSVDDIYPRKQFDAELKKMLPLCLLLGLAMYPALLVPALAAPSLAGDADMAALRLRPTAQSAARLADLVDDFIRWKLL